MRRADCPTAKNGYGLEVSYEVTRIKVGRDSVKHDPVPTAIDVKCTGADACETTKHYVSDKPHWDPVSYLVMELALGYSQFSGFSSSDPNLELQGAVRELPAVSIYFTLMSDRRLLVPHWVSPYIGVRSGLIQLSNVTLNDRLRADTLVTYPGAASAFQFGGVAGLGINVGDRMNFFIEVADQIRRFPSVQWSSPGTNKIRDTFPRSLNFSGPALTAGVQVTIRKPTP